MAGSNVTIAMLPLAQECKRVFIVEPAVTDSIICKDLNRYVFRTDHNSSMDAISSAMALSKPVVSIATLVAEEYAPVATTDFTASALRLFNVLRTNPARKSSSCCGLQASMRSTG